MSAAMRGYNSVYKGSSQVVRCQYSTAAVFASWKRLLLNLLWWCATASLQTMRRPASTSRMPPTPIAIRVSFQVLCGPSGSTAPDKPMHAYNQWHAGQPMLP
eukprot:2424795-Amphidinium_carterae.1